MNVAKVLSLAIVSLFVAGWQVSLARYRAQRSLLGGGKPADAAAASQHPDEYAWQLLLFLNLQVKSRSGGVSCRPTSLLERGLTRCSSDFRGRPVASLINA